MVADVSGKGVSSALLASLLQGALIAASDHPERAWRCACAASTGFLLERTRGEKYATVFQSLLHRDGKLSYVNAAHCPPLVIRANGALSELEVTGMPVGLIEGAEFTLAEEQLSPGDKLLIYSDGVTEAQNSAGDFFGKKRLREVVAAHASQSAAAVHDASAGGRDGIYRRRGAIRRHHRAGSGVQRVAALKNNNLGDLGTWPLMFYPQ